MRSPCPFSRLQERAAAAKAMVRAADRDDRRREKQRLQEARFAKRMAMRSEKDEPSRAALARLRRADDGDGSGDDGQGSDGGEEAGGGGEAEDELPPKKAAGRSERRGGKRGRSEVGDGDGGAKKGRRAAGSEAAGDDLAAQEARALRLLRGQ